MNITHKGKTISSTNPLETQLTGSNASDAQALWTPGMLYNGTTSDKPRGNTQGTLLASAARTTTSTAPTQKNYNAKGVHLILNITVASGTGGLQVKVFGVDPVSGASYQLNAVPTAIIATGAYAYELYPGGGAVGSPNPAWLNASTNRALPPTWFVNVVHGDTSSYTYSVGYALIL